MKTKHMLFFILVPILLLLGVSAILRPDSQARGPSDSVACLIAEKFVAQQLKAPSTAEFAPDCSVSKRQEVWTVRAYVDAQNG